jgi:multidrug efflux system outer membrane protein
MLISYQRTIQNALREVSDSLIGHEKAKEYRVSQELFDRTLRDQSHQADLRYRGGVSSYLEVLDTERQRLAAEQVLAQAQRDELTSLVQLYKALGGGWQ